MYIDFWVEVGFDTHPVFGAMFALLEQRNVRWRLTFPQQELWRLDRLSVDADVYMIQSANPLTLGLEPVLEAKGARLVNPYQASLFANDPILVAAALMQARIRTPRTGVAARPSQLSTKLAGHGVVLQSSYARQGYESTRDSQRTGIPIRSSDDDPVVGQAAVRNIRDQYTAYAVGERVVALRAEPRDNGRRPARPVRLSRQGEETARACGAALGLELYSVDMVEDADGVQVLDIHSFPDYLDVPDAAQWLAEYAISAGGR